MLSGFWILDLLTIALVVWLGIRGWSDGLVNGVFGFVGFFIALYAGARFAPALGDLVGVDTATGFRYGVAFLVMFILVLVAIRLVAVTVSKTLAVTPLGIINNIGGAAFGALKAMLWLAVLAIPLAMLPLPSSLSGAYLESPLVKSSMRVGGALVRVIEPITSEPLGRFIDEARRYIDEDTESLDIDR